MELDELKEKWAEHDRKLEISIRLNRQLLRDTYTRRARFALWRLAGMLALGSIVMLAIIVALGRYIAMNWFTPRFSVPASILDMLAIATLAALIAQIGLALSIDYSQPVAMIQKRLETLRKFRIRYIQAFCLLTALIWAPMFIVLMIVLMKIGFDTAWVAENIAIGLLLLAIVLGLGWRYGTRLTNTAVGRRFVRDLAGYNLDAASRFLSSMEEFERDHSPQERSSMREYSPDE